MFVDDMLCFLNEPLEKNLPTKKKQSSYDLVALCDDKYRPFL